MSHEFITGEAGTGKTTILKDRCADPSYGMMVSTTGISAVNLGTQTLNSLLGYFDTKDLERIERRGKLAENLEDLVDSGVLGTHLCIDEVSMMDAPQLDIIHDALRETCPHVGLVLSGDFCQLPPVNAPFAFKANCWPDFEKNTTVLRLNHRQKEDSVFLTALRHIRQGDREGAQMLKEAGAQFGSTLNPEFPGITVFPTNEEANGMNGHRFAILPGQPVIYPIETRGQQLKEWKETALPVLAKVGARVLITANDTPAFRFANGDLGTITAMSPNQVVVQLDRTGEEVVVGKITRRHFDYPGGIPSLRGSVTYLPIKLGYALTIHKCQGLTLPRIQIVTRHETASNSALMYVACSRARTADSVYIVGTVEELASKIKSHPEVKRFL